MALGLPPAVCNENDGNRHTQTGWRGEIVMRASKRWKSRL